jgi:hypothetical protein
MNGTLPYKWTRCTTLCRLPKRTYLHHSNSGNLDGGCTVRLGCSTPYSMLIGSPTTLTPNRNSINMFIITFNLVVRTGFEPTFRRPRSLISAFVYHNDFLTIIEQQRVYGAIPIASPTRCVQNYATASTCLAGRPRLIVSPAAILAA